MAAKRKPTPAKGKVNNSGKNTTKKTDVTSATQEKDKNITVFNSALDPALITKDVYEAELGNTINSLYKFSTTMSLGDIQSSLKGGLGTLGKISSYLSKARELSSTIKKGDYLKAIGDLAPGAKAAMTKAGMDASMIDKIQAGAQMVYKTKGAYENIRNGKVDLLTGLNDLAKSVLGVDLAVIKDLQAIKNSTSAIIKEFSKAGLAIKDEWGKLVNEWDTKENKVKDNGWKIGTDVATMTLDTLGENGDYLTMLEALKHADPNKMEQIGAMTVKNMIVKYSANSVFNKGKDPLVIFREIMEVIYAFRGGECLWVDRGEGNRKAFNLKMFLDGSEDFKKMIIAANANKFFLEDTATNGLLQLGYTEKKNEIFSILIQLKNVFKQNDNFKEELRKDFPDFIFNETEKVNPNISPNAFKPRVHY